MLSINMKDPGVWAEIIRTGLTVPVLPPSSLLPHSPPRSPLQVRRIMQILPSSLPFRSAVSCKSRGEAAAGQGRRGGRPGRPSGGRADLARSTKGSSLSTPRLFR